MKAKYSVWPSAPMAGPWPAAVVMTEPSNSGIQHFSSTAILTDLAAYLIDGWLEMNGREVTWPATTGRPDRGAKGLVF